ncbi:MAG: cyclic nucleotide-binding domain-containing protein [Candidatus Muiribacteriota bacterium]
MINVAALNDIEIFRNFSQEELETFLKNAVEYELRSDEILFHEGETGTEMFIILSGEISIYKELELDEPKLLVTLSDGAFLGEMSLVDKTPRSAMAKAGDSTVKMVVFSRGYIESMAESELDIVCKFMLNIIKIGAQRSRMTTERLISSRQTLGNIKN